MGPADLFPICHLSPPAVSSGGAHYTLEPARPPLVLSLGVSWRMRLGAIRASDMAGSDMLP
jgi:hypothetical protein